MQILWEEEFAQLSLQDSRVKDRLVSVLKTLQGHPGASLLEAAKDIHQAKAAYRLMDNPKLESQSVLQEHRRQTFSRMENEPVVLVLQDTTVLSFETHLNAKGLGRIGKQAGQAQASQGLHVHTALAVTPKKVALGILDQAIWPRREAPRGKAKWTRKLDEKESMRWLLSLEKSVSGCTAPQNQQPHLITVSDRESDINAYLGEAVARQADIVLRARGTRLEKEGQRPLAKALLDQPVIFTMPFEVSRNARPTAYKKKKVRLAQVERRWTVLEVRFQACLLAIEDRQETPSTHPFYCIQVREAAAAPEGWESLEWFLITTLPIHSAEDAQRVIGYYETRWVIEVFHRVFKADLRVEDCRLETAERLQRFLTLESLIAMQICRMTYFQREKPEASCEEVLPEALWDPLYRLSLKKAPDRVPTAAEVTLWMAKLGGYPARASDPPPGPTVLKRGWRRLQDLALGFELARSHGAICG